MPNDGSAYLLLGLTARYTKDVQGIKRGKTMHDTKIGALLSDVVFLGLATTVGYMLAYSYQCGYCRFFNVPFELVKVDTADLIWICLAMVAIGPVIIVSLYFYTLPFGAMNNPVIIALRQRVAFRVLPFLCASSILVILCGFSVTTLTIFMTVFAFSSFRPGFVDRPCWSEVSRKKWEGHRRKMVTVMPEMSAGLNDLPVSKVAYVAGELERMKKKGIFDRAEQAVNPWLMSMILVTVLSLPISFYFGYLRAESQEEFWVTSIEHRPWVVLRIYGDNMVVARLQRGKRRIGPVYRVVQAKLDGGDGFVAKNIGPLRVADRYPGREKRAYGE